MSDPLVDPISGYMFDTPEPSRLSSNLSETTLGAATSSGLLDLLFTHMSVSEVVTASSLCADPTRPANEAEWNDKVHARVLSIALKMTTSLVYHNITAVGPA